ACSDCYKTIVVSVRHDDVTRLVQSQTTGPLPGIVGGARCRPEPAFVFSKTANVARTHEGRDVSGSIHLEDHSIVVEVRIGDVNISRRADRYVGRPPKAVLYGSDLSVANLPDGAVAVVHDVDFVVTSDEYSSWIGKRSVQGGSAISRISLNAIACDRVYQ